MPKPRRTRAHPPRPESQGERLLSAVERLVDDADTLIATVEAFKSASTREADRTLVAGHIITEFSTRSALSGAISALPALLPGGGSAIALLGGSLFDVGLVLKCEVEMILCLTHLYGHDIREEKARWLAFVLAGIRTYEVQTGRNYFADLAVAELEALPRYAPRQLFKLAATALGRILLASAPRGLVRALPVLGILVGASANKYLTTSVGWWCVDALERKQKQSDDLEDAPVDAFVL